jgi:TatD DNase family protein
MWIDTHCHLDAAEFDADRDVVYHAARAAGVERIVVPAVAAANFPVVRCCVAAYPGTVAAYGIHPMMVADAKESDLDVLRDWLSREHPVAVGEIGLDGFIDQPDWERQEFFFLEQLKLAREFDLPVLLHIRRAQDRVLKCLRRIGVRSGIAHAFNGSRQQADAFIALGFKLGFGGAMTYPRATRIRALAATLPMDAIVLETDAPEMAPAFAAPGRNTPEYLPRIAQTLAQLRRFDITKVRHDTGRNAAVVLGFEARGGADDVEVGGI